FAWTSKRTWLFAGPTGRTNVFRGERPMVIFCRLRRRRSSTILPPWMMPIRRTLSAGLALIPDPPGADEEAGAPIRTDGRRARRIRGPQSDGNIACVARSPRVVSFLERRLLQRLENLRGQPRLQLERLEGHAGPLDHV